MIAETARATPADAAPAPYPPHWEADVVLADGGTVHLRPITPADGDRLVKFHSKLSPQTIYYRFFAAYPVLSDSDVFRFTTVDQRTAAVWSRCSARSSSRWSATTGSPTPTTPRWLS